MKFRYLGKHEDMKVFGYDFSGGKTPDVTDEKAIKKLSGNSHFEAIEEETTPEDDKASEESKAPNQNEILHQIKAATSLEELGKLAEGEGRKPILDAIEKKKAELAK